MGSALRRCYAFLDGLQKGLTPDNRNAKKLLVEQMAYHNAGAPCGLADPTLFPPISESRGSVSQTMLKKTRAKF